MAVAALNLGPGAGRRFLLEFTGAGGTRRREPLSACVTERFESALPVRSFQWAKGASHFPGYWWSSTTGDHVGFESWLERDHVMVMDFDPDITGIASQPFWLHWQDEDGRPRGIFSPGGPMAAPWWSIAALMTRSRRGTPGCSA